MASISSSQIATVNQKLQADPRYQAALKTYQQEYAASAPESITAARGGDSGSQQTDVQDARSTAAQKFASTVKSIISGYGLSGQPQAWLFDPGKGQVVYEEDHSLRNTLLAVGGVIALGGVVSAIGSAGAGAAGAGAAGGAPLASIALPATGALVIGTAASTAVPTALAAAAPALASAAPALASAVPAAASVAGPAVAKVAGTTLTSDLLRYGVPVAGNVIGGIIQANAAGKASEAQQKYLEEALAYEKEKDTQNIAREAGRYGDFTRNIEPYLSTGETANTRMASLLGLPPSSSRRSTTTSAPVTTQPVARTTTAAPQSTAPAQTVMLQAPDGTTKDVPASQVDFYLQRGAKRVA